MDREQVRRDARFHADHSASTPVTKSLARDCLALLAELEQAKRVRAEYDRELEVRTRALEQAERERDEARSDLHAERVLHQNHEAWWRDREARAEAQLAKVPALVEALRNVVRTDHWRGPDGTRESWVHWRSQVESALAAYEQAQGETP